MVLYGTKINKALAFVSMAMACGFANHIAFTKNTLAHNMTTASNATPANNERERERVTPRKIFLAFNYYCERI